MDLELHNGLDLGERRSMRGLRFHVVVLLLIGFLGLTSAALGQISGDILVQAEDPSGSAVPNATVTLRSLQTGASRTATTLIDGSARFTQLGVGDYEVKVEAAGFVT